MAICERCFFDDHSLCEDNPDCTCTTPGCRPTEAQLLRAAGYAIVSRKYCIAARIDRPDWKDVCAVKGYPVDADWYRRCVTTDRVTVSEETRRLLPKSREASFDYLSKVEES